MSDPISRLSKADKAKLLELCRQLGQQASRAAYGSRGADLQTTLVDIEKQTGPLFDAFLDGLLGHAVGGQAEQLVGIRPCPECGRECNVTQSEEPRVMESERGRFAWQESTAKCPHCERAFFPSASGTAHQRQQI